MIRTPCALVLWAPIVRCSILLRPKETYLCYNRGGASSGTLRAVFLRCQPTTPEIFDLVSPFVNHPEAQPALRLSYLSALDADKLGDRLNANTLMKKNLAANESTCVLVMHGFI